MFVWKILKVCAVQIHLWHFCWHRACYPPSVLDFPAWTPASFIQKQCWHTSPQDPRIHGKTVGMPWVKRSRLLVNVRTYEHWCLGPFTSWQLHHHWEPVLTSVHTCSQAKAVAWGGTAHPAASSHEFHEFLALSLRQVQLGKTWCIDWHRVPTPRSLVFPTGCSRCPSASCLAQCFNMKIYDERPISNFQEKHGKATYPQPLYTLTD